MLVYVHFNPGCKIE
jgi:hypothetical protein